MEKSMEKEKNMIKMENFYVKKILIMENVLMNLMIN